MVNKKSKSGQIVVKTSKINFPPNFLSISNGVSHDSPNCQDYYLSIS